MNDRESGVNPLTIELDPETAILLLEEAEGARNWRHRLVSSLQTIRGNLDPIEDEIRLSSEADLLDRAATVIRHALYGDPSLADGDHYAGRVGLHRLRVARPPRGGAEPSDLVGLAAGPGGEQ